MQGTKQPDFCSELTTLIASVELSNDYRGKELAMFYWIAVVLTILWLSGFVSSFTLFGSFSVMAILIIASLVKVVGGHEPM